MTAGEKDEIERKMRELFSGKKRIELDEDIKSVTQFMILKKRLRNFDVQTEVLDDDPFLIGFNPGDEDLSELFSSGEMRKYMSPFGAEEIKMEATDPSLSTVTEAEAHQYAFNRDLQKKYFIQKFRTKVRDLLETYRTNFKEQLEQKR